MSKNEPDVTKNYVELLVEVMNNQPIIATLVLVVIVGITLKVKSKRRKRRKKAKSHRRPSKKMDFSQMFSYFQNRKISKQILALTAQVKEIDIDTFFRMRQRSMKSYTRASTRPRASFSGVYILHNKTKNRRYVGQGQSIFDSVDQHFTGNGNRNIYTDYRNGDTWSILMIDFDKTPFDTLNTLERHTIRAYGAFRKGYNRNRGNQ